MPAWMKAALGFTVPLERRQVAGAAGITYRLAVPPWGLGLAFRQLRRLRRAASGDHEFLRLSFGFGSAGALYLLAVAASASAVERLRAGPDHERLVRRWGDRLWWSAWEPESEFGQWDHLRLREGQLGDAPLLVDERLPAEVGASKWGRETLRDRLAVVDPATLHLVELLASELIGNIVRHAQVGPTDSIGLRVRVQGDWLRVEVTSRGKRFEPHVPIAKTPDEESGWGLYMINQQVDRWGIIDRPDERQVWFELRHPPR